MKPIRSLISRTVIQAQRWFDHLRRYLTGVPSAKRSEITPQLYIGGQFFEHGLDDLQKWGIGAVVNMREESKPHAFSQVPWLKTLHLPTPDHHAPSLTQLQSGVDFISDQITQGKKVYIHCRAGEGRAPTMAAAYLISKGIALDDALLLLKSARPFIALSIDQTRILLQWEKRFQQNLS
ncbi:MAG: phosphatase [Patescibacteria group bacterium]|nr:MAG: phosphatase [Patescibacteria group bacterium]